MKYIVNFCLRYYGIMWSNFGLRYYGIIWSNFSLRYYGIIWSNFGLRYYGIIWSNFGLRYYGIIWSNLLKPCSLSTVTSVARVQIPLLECPGGGKVIIKPFLHQTFIFESII